MPPLEPSQPTIPGPEYSNIAENTNKRLEEINDKSFQEIQENTNKMKK